jgi:hypothetical protein
MKQISLALIFGTLLTVCSSSLAFAGAAGVSDSALANGAFKPTKGWLTFELIDARRGIAVMQRTSKGIAAAFRLFEGEKVIQEYVLAFPFKGRRADLKNTDLQILTNCIDQFNTVVTNPGGGDFYINASADESVGVLCSARPIVQYK